MKKLVVLSGSGISAESGLSTFRDSGGLWEGFKIEEVASIDGWYEDPVKVMDFYNQRRKNALNAKPNRGHLILAELEKYFSVTIITQNVDNLHEQAGSKKIIHLHGELFKARSTGDENLIYDIEGWELNIGDTCEKGYQLRPHIVWFGEMVPMMDIAIHETRTAEIFLVVGTSLVVYPAAGLLEFVNKNVPVFVVDPVIPRTFSRPGIHPIEEKASTGMEKVRDELIARYIH
jgi:NAD-dependent deacetylase